MARQHATPVLLTTDGSFPLAPLSLLGGEQAVSEAQIQSLIHQHPRCLPIAEIDPMFTNPVPVCTELNTTAGPIDNFMVTPTGLPVLVECKLWRNPEGRREVVGQILDYAKELTRWSSADVQREVGRRTQRSGNAVLELVRAAGHEVDEVDFNDALTANLRKGRFLLLIVGDGIREGVEAITEYLQRHAGLHFSLGLVELSLYALPNGDSVVLPRVLAKTLVVRREVVAAPDGYLVADADTEALGDRTSAPADPYVEPRLSFLRDLVSRLKFSDPEQPVPTPTPKGYLFVYMPAPKSTCWINVSVRHDQIGLWLVSNRDSIGDKALQRVLEEWSVIQPEVDGQAELKLWRGDASRKWVAEDVPASPFGSPEERNHALNWFCERLNTWVSLFRPRIRSAVADIEREGA